MFHILLFQIKFFEDLPEVLAEVIEELSTTDDVVEQGRGCRGVSLADKGGYGGYLDVISI
jgi:hypothetical protein